MNKDVSKTVPFLTFTPQLVTVFGHLWDTQGGKEAFRIFGEPCHVGEVYENIIGDVYNYGDVIDGLHGHQLIVGMHILLEDHELKDFCCLRASECDSSMGHPVLVATEQMDEMAMERHGKTIAQLLEEGDAGEEKVEKIERDFDSEYVYLRHFVEEACAMTK